MKDYSLLFAQAPPPDLAWVQAIDFLKTQNQALAMHWGTTVWDTAIENANKTTSVIKIILSAGDSLKKAIQISLMDGRPCFERIEATLYALKTDTRNFTEREIALLPTRTLKPLFLIVAPSLFSLIAYALYLSWISNESYF